MLALILLFNGIFFIQHVSAACSGTHLMLLWDPANTIPANWQALDATHTINGTDPTGKFIRGDAVADVGATGGGGQTNATLASTTIDTPSTTAGSGGNGGNTSPVGHNHNITTVIGADSNGFQPSYRTLQLIRYAPSSGSCIPNVIPNQAITMFTSLTGVSNVVRYSLQDNRMVKIDNTVTTGGSDSATNQVCGAGSSPPTTCNNMSLAAATPAGSIANPFLGSTATAASTHTHTLTAGTASSATPAGAAGNADPPYVQPILGQLTADIPAISLNFIAMFDGDPGTGWNVLSETGGQYNEVFLRPNSSGTYSAASVGQLSHTNFYAIRSGTATPNGSNTSSLALDGQLAGSAHTHLVTFILTPQSNVPPYVNVVIDQKVNFTLSHFRWYVPANAYAPTDRWPAGTLDLADDEQLHAVPVPYSAPTPGTKLRLRIQIQVTGQALALQTISFKLQYAKGTAASNCTSGSWLDVDSNGVFFGNRDWRYDNVSGLTDGNQLPSALFGTTNQRENFYESASTGAGFTNPAAASSGNFIEYDWAIEDYNAPGANAYYFRVVENQGVNDDGRVLSVYSTCPGLITKPTTDQLLRHGEFFLNNVSSGDPDQGFIWAD